MARTRDVDPCGTATAAARAKGGGRRWLWVPLGCLVAVAALCCPGLVGRGGVVLFPLASGRLPSGRVVEIGYGVRAAQMAQAYPEHYYYLAVRPGHRRMYLVLTFQETWRLGGAELHSTPDGQRIWLVDTKFGTDHLAALDLSTGEFWDQEWFSVDPRLSLPDQEATRTRDARSPPWQPSWADPTGGVVVPLHPRWAAALE